jgi:hypothetical protein
MSKDWVGNDPGDFVDVEFAGLDWYLETELLGYYGVDLTEATDPLSIDEHL